MTTAAFASANPGILRDGDGVEHVDADSCGNQHACGFRTPRRVLDRVGGASHAVRAGRTRAARRARRCHDLAHPRTGHACVPRVGVLGGQWLQRLHRRRTTGRGLSGAVDAGRLHRGRLRSVARQRRPRVLVRSHPQHVLRRRSAIFRHDVRSERATDVDQPRSRQGSGARLLDAAGVVSNDSPTGAHAVAYASRIRTGPTCRSGTS